MRELAIGLGAAACVAVACPQTATASSADSRDGTSEFRLLELDGHHVKWGDAALGTGATVTYAFVTEPRRFQAARNCASLVSMDALAARFGISQGTLEAETAAAFRVWEEAADIRFVAVENAGDADILIGAQGEPVGRAYVNVTYRAEDVDEGVKIIDRALICLNPEHSWKVGFDGDTDVYDIRYTLVHEIGHAIGLDHPGPSGQVMSFSYEEKFRALQAGDLQGVAELYGSSRSEALLADAPDSGEQPVEVAHHEP